MGESAARKCRKSETVGLSHERRCVESQLPEQHRFAMITLSSRISSFGWLANEKVLRCTFAVLGIDVPLDGHVWPTNVLQSSGFLLHESGTRPRPVC